jgi:hexokinase
MNDLARQLVSKISIGQQSGAMQMLILGTAMNGNYYEAYSSIPEIALIDRLFYFNVILASEGLRRTNDSEWSRYFGTFQDFWIWQNSTYDLEIF